jgi:hypothetical protein
VAIDIRSLISIDAIEEEVDRLAGMMSGQNPETNAMLMVALEIRALRWTLVGQPDDEDRDTITDRLITAIDSVTDYLGDKSDEVAGAIDNLTEVFLPSEPPMPRWYRVYRWLRD